MFNASVKIKPLKPNSSFNKPVTIFLESVDGLLIVESKQGILKCATIKLDKPFANNFLKG